MARNPLQVLLRLRGIELDAGRRALAERMREEGAAAERCSGLAATIAGEAAVQLSQPVEYRTTDLFAAWSDRSLAALQAARTASSACAAATAETRTTLNQARAATRALEALLEHARDASRKAAAHLEQQALDEAAVKCKPPEGWSG